MLMSAKQSPGPDATAPRGLTALARRWPFVTFFLLAVVSNVFGSIFNITYNLNLIVGIHLKGNAAQLAAWEWVLQGYNLVAYPLCLGLLIYLVWPLSRCLGDLRAGRPIAPERLEGCRRRVVNLPFFTVCLNFLGWAPGAVVFPLAICLGGGWANWWPIWWHFVVSFFVSALLTTAQTFFILELFLMAVVYPDFFRDARPAEVRGVWRVSFTLRLFLYWAAVGLVPVLAVLAVALDFSEGRVELFPVLHGLSLGAAAVGVASSGLISYLVGWDILAWIHAHAEATRQITRGNFAHRIPDLRPDELGRLTDGFNDMAAGLAEAELMRQTVGQFVRPDVWQEILLRYPELGGSLQEVTVLFIDIRGFTRRSASESPEQIVALLNRFFTLTVETVEPRGGLVSKFLGDGVLALFNVPRPVLDHADRAVGAALDLLGRLEELNRELLAQGHAPLAIGAGIHSGPAVVGCMGATWVEGDGRKQIRKEFTAIGETVNLGQRIEQMTKHCGGPILLSEQTRCRLQGAVPLTHLGAHEVAGWKGTLELYRVNAA